MNITVEPQPNCRATLHIEIPPADVKKERESVLNNYALRARLPGFRPGKAPKQVVATKFAGEIQEELQSALVRRGYSEAEQRDDLDILNVVDVKDTTLHKDESFTFTMEVSTAPRFELPEYKGIPVKLPTVEVTDADVDHQLLHIREHHRTFQDLDREAAMGDFIVIDATGTVDGQPIADAFPEAPASLKKVDGTWLEMTEKEKFLPGFFAALQGIKKGETRDVTVALPEDFPFEPMRNKTVVMSVHCKELKQGNLPELDEAFAHKINPSWDLEQLRSAVRDSLQQRQEQAREEKKTNEIISFLGDRLEFELPADVVNREAQRRTNDIAMNALRQGMNQENIMAVQDQIVSAATAQARQNVKVRFILSEVAKRERIKVSEIQIQTALANIARQRKISPKKLMAEARKNNLVEAVHHDLLLDNALDFLKQNAVIEDIAPEKEDCGHDHS